MSINFYSGLEITLLKNPGYPRSWEPWFLNEKWHFLKDEIMSPYLVILVKKRF